MEITLKSLKEKDACAEFVKWFRKNFGKEADSEEIIKKLRDIKDTREWMYWLFYEYNLSGICEKWWDDGKIRYRINYKDGKAHGLCKWWFENGQLEYRINYKDGKLHGLGEKWYNEGELDYRINFKDGVIVKEEKVK